MLRRAIEIYNSEGAAVLAGRAARIARERFNRRAVDPVCSLKYNLLNGDGVDVMAEDWDNLIILDACRYDVFDQECDLVGRLESRVSRGTTSWYFMEGNFVGRKLHGTVYVTSNPWVHRLDDDIFHATLDNPMTEAWNEEYGTVMPESMTEAALNAHKRFPNKRLVVHYMQPHLPHIGEVADEVNEQIELSGYDKFRSHTEKEEKMEGVPMCGAYRRGVVDLITVEAAYRESLSIALDSVRELLNSIDGKSVITADHGELLGDRPSILHPPSFGHDHLPRTEKLCKIPWFVVEGDDRRRVFEEPPIEGETMDQEVAERRLEQLGYKQ